MTGFEWFLVGLAFLIDIFSYAGGRSAREARDGTLTRDGGRARGDRGRRPGQREPGRRDLQVVPERPQRRHRARESRVSCASARNGSLGTRCWTWSIDSYFQRWASENAP